VKVKVERVNVNEDPGHAAVDIGCPPPSVILSRELKVQERHRDKRRHSNQQNKRQKQNAKESVDLMTPHTCKDVMQLDVNG
jgi:ribosomal protein L11